MENVDSVLYYIIENVMEMVIAVAVVFTSYYGRKYLGIVFDREEDTDLENLVMRLVLAAEEGITGGEDKYEWVAKVLSERIDGLDEQQLYALIHEQVRLMRAAGLELKE